MRAQSSGAKLGKPMAINFSQFFPPLRGTLGEATVIVPSNTVSVDLSAKGDRGTLWGTAKDVEKVAGGSAVNMKLAQHTMLRVSYAQGVGEKDGRLVEDGVPLSKESLTKKGYQLSSFRLGYFHGLHSAPAAIVVGKYQGKSVSMAYVSDVATNTVLQAELAALGKTPGEGARVWKDFVSGLELRN